MSAALFLDIDGTVCPQAVRRPLDRGVRHFPSPIGDVWADQEITDRIKALDGRKWWCSTWEDLVTSDMQEAFGITAYCTSDKWDQGHERWTDWWKADELISWIEPWATHPVTQVVWCDDELGDAQNADAIEVVRETLNGWCVNLQLIAPNPVVGLTREDLALVQNLMRSTE